MGTDRHALLVGVPEQTGPGFPLPSIGDPVREDLRLMREALEAGGYLCKVIGAQDAGESRRDVIQDAIREALRSAPPGGVLLVHFSGHGMHLDGKDHFVPANAQGWGDGGVDVDSLIDLDRDFFGMLRTTGCPAALVLACFDACRDGSAEQAIRPYHYRAPEPTQLVVANSCAPGETSGYEEDGSHFTKALAHALHPDSSHRTLQQVSASVMAQLRGRDQHPRWSPAGELPDFVVAEADSVPEWVAAVSGARLWGLPCSDPQALQDVLRERVEAAVRDLSGKYRKACEQLPHPWRDDGFPVRVLDSVVDLPAGTRSLSALEKALLCGLPFMLATALAEEFASLYDAFRGFDGFDAPRVQGVLADHGFSPLEENRVRRLHARGRTAEAWALAAWRLSKRGSSLRLAGAEGKDHLADCAERLVDVLLRGTAASHLKQLRTIVDRLARHHLSYPSCTALTSYAGDSNLFKVTAADASHLNDHDLAVRWSVGAALAVDVRELSEMVGEHIGTMYPLGPEEVLACLAEASRRFDDERALVEVLQCPHGAVHKALEVHASRCREALSPLQGVGLPAYLTWLRSVRTIDVSVHSAPGAYNLPLLTFQFDQRAVSHLLMGKQLYGDPALALRELYQNALDACRYRMYRDRWAASQGGGDPDWKGRIRITQYQENGRTVIECLDNGVGMTGEQLKDLFARAGRRLSDSSAFQHELGEWQQAGIEARFNSRFGIGVLSYFMLADEITVVTRPTDAYGQSTAEALQADIVGTATLFRIGPARRDNGDVAKVQHGGTLVRLYLSDEPAGPTAGGVSASRTLGELLWYSEFDTRVQDESTGHHVVWNHHELRIPDRPAREVCAVDGAPGELWWVEGDGRLLADGIATQQQTFGCVVNVRDQRDLTLSVSRNEVQSWDRAKVADLLTAHLPKLASWPRVTLAWLLRFGLRAPRLGDDLLRVFADRPLRVENSRDRGGQPSESTLGRGRVLRLSDIGWCPLDVELLTGNPSSEISAGSLVGEKLRGWRSSVLGQNSPLDHNGRVPVRTVLSLLSANLGGSYSGLKALLSPPGGPETSAPSASISAADWYLHYFASPGRPKSVVWLPVEVTERAVLGWRRTLFGCAEDFSFPDSLEANADVARLMATQDIRKEKHLWERCGQWPWHILVATAARHRVPLGELWARFEDFPESWFGPLPELPEHLFDRVPRPGDAVWASRTASRTDGLLGPKALRDWVARYDVLGAPPHVRRLLGYLDVRDALTPETRSLAEHLMSFGDLLYDGGVRVLDVVRTAARGQAPVADVLDLAAQLREPLELTGLPAVDHPDVCPPEWLADAFFPPREPDTPEEADRFLSKSNLFSIIGHVPADQLHQGFDVLRGLGYTCPVAPSSLPGLLDGDDDPWALDLVTGESDAPDNGDLLFVDSSEIDARKLLWFAARRGLTVGAAFDIASDVSERLGVRLSVQPPDALRDLLVTSALWTAVHGAENLVFSLANRLKVTPLSVARLAYLEEMTLGEAVEALRPFREVGVPVPDLDGAAGEVRAYKPTEDDLWALSQDRDASLPATPLDVDPLSVLRAALRLGRTFRSVHRMFAAYRPFGLTLDFPEPAEETGVPCWEDAVILSFAGDGQAPALSGAVGERRIAWCAEAVGRPDDPEWARERLRLYAPVFGLEIPDPPLRTEKQ
ncbi:caspase family protein [Streptomyces sp. NPDC017448]|uniref:caspase family protein n=1 Tax=Streptomyces sp. NPDC017448 TaxID=3364996 RepID=UPI0037AE1D5A